MGGFTKKPRAQLLLSLPVLCATLPLPQALPWDSASCQSSPASPQHLAHSPLCPGPESVCLAPAHGQPFVACHRPLPWTCFFEMSPVKHPLPIQLCLWGFLQVYAVADPNRFRGSYLAPSCPPVQGRALKLLSKHLVK